ncbi:hypothetical protein ACF1AB_06075 [Streptomyces sp. NPDC014846]|uniref:hypothetical protein n=1 Tax=Streptomyces sp. NPDC014846 TaxID=3364922 RepID=UPI0036F64F19
MQRRVLMYLSPAISVVVAGTALATASPASAQTTVPCSATALVAAVANPGAGPVLELTPGCRYVLTSSLQVNRPLTIHGNNARLTRDNSSGPFGIVKVHANLDLDRITITNGDATTSGPDFGGGIAVHNGTLNLDRSTLRDNRGNFSGGLGGLTGTTIHLTQTMVSDNHAFNNGGGVVTDGTLTLWRSRVVNNSADGKGGGIASDGNVSVDDSNINANTAGVGGGFANIGPGTATLTDTNVNDNRATNAPGGIDNEGGSTSVTLIRSRVNGNTPTNCAPTVVVGCRN